MIPNIHIHERLMFERHQERQREMAQHRRTKEAPRQRPGRARRFLASMGTLLLTVRTRVRRLQPSESKVVYEHCSV